MADAANLAGRPFAWRYRVGAVPAFDDEFRGSVRLAREEGCDVVAHGAASKGNDQVRMETAIAAQDPRLHVIAPVRDWPLKNLQDKLRYARNRGIPVDEPTDARVIAAIEKQLK